MSVGVVDYQQPDAPAEFTRSLRETGFAVVVNHPLPWALVEEIYVEWSAFFDSPAVHRYTTPDRNVGYFPPSISEVAKGHEARDLKEFFHIFPWSEYPAEVSDAAQRYREIATDMAATLLAWVERHTPGDVSSRFSVPLTSMLDGSESLLRVLRYPPLPPMVPEGAERAAAHEDINLLTVLPAGSDAGLELLGSDGAWYPVPCDPGSVAVNAGEMLDLASDGYYPATTHRVVNPIGPSARTARMSMPLFLSPAPDVVLAHGRTAGEFLAERITELNRKG